MKQANPAALARIALPVLLAALAACDGLGDPGAAQGPSTIRFTYSGSGPGGAVQGAYQAEGDYQVGTAPLRQTFALGHRYRPAGAVDVMSNVYRASAGASDAVHVTITRLTPGSVPVDRLCDADFCPGVSLALELPNVNGAQARYSCSLQAGRVEITSIREDRMQGRFSGTGSCTGAAGTQDLEEFSISGGEFNVKLMDAVF